MERYGVLVECYVCKDSYDLAKILFIPCGHGYCPNCTGQMTGRATCPVCREDKRGYEPRRIYMPITGTAPIDLESPASASVANKVARGLNKIDAETPALSIERATRELKRELSKNLEEDTKIELVEALQRLEKRTLPICMDVQKYKDESKTLRQAVDTLEHRLTQLDTLQSENSRLREDLADARNKVDQNFALAQSAREQVIRVKEDEEQLKRTVQRQHKTLHRKEMELEQMRKALEESEKKRHLTQTKLKALAKPMKTSSKRTTQDLDDSLVVVDQPILGGLSPAPARKRRRGGHISS